MHPIVTEGWRGLAHSFSIVNDFLSLALSRQAGLAIYHRELPYYNPAWQPTPDLFGPKRAQRLASIPAPPEDLRPAAVLRHVCPFDFTQIPGTRTVVFATSEFGMVSRAAVRERRTLGEALAGQDITVITPSHWSREGLLMSGADPARVVILPHGVAPGIFRPLPEPVRQALRRKLGWEDHCVFLNVSAMTPNKGLPDLLRAFAHVHAHHPETRLMLKGLDSVYDSQRTVRETLGTLLPARAAQSAIGYLGGTQSFAQIAAYYQCADVYVSPYTAEGFNLPVIEAIACGLAVICTGGGATDDFTEAAFSRRITSRIVTRDMDGDVPARYLEPDPEHLAVLMDEAITDHAWRQSARAAGPAFVARGYTWAQVAMQLRALLLT
jgi:glycosyltransferase involved in cell wall biosynthesis